MTAKWRTAGDPAPVSGTDNADVWMTKAANGVDSASTRNANATDPSSGWTIDQDGTLWLNITDLYNTVQYDFAKKDDATFAFRRSRLRRFFPVIVAAASALVTFSPASPQTANVAFAAGDVDLTTLLDTLQDANFTTPLVTRVRLRVIVRASVGTIATGAVPNAYIAFRKNGLTTVQEAMCRCQVANVEAEYEIEVDLDTSEIMEFKIEIPGGGAGELTYRAYVCGFYEDY